MIPGNTTPEFFGAASASGGAYSISRSLRFNSADSAYLSRTPASAGNRKTWTWAGWVKRSALGTDQNIFGTNSTTGLYFQFQGDNTFKVLDYTGSTSNYRLETTQVFRDVGAWMHILFALDTTLATANDRIKLYVNGTQITAFSTRVNPSQNYDGVVNSATTHTLGRLDAQWYLDAYLADIYFIDGQALTPSSFTETDATTGQLIPKAFSGSYGSQGWHLEFADNSSNTATTLGKDTSGNSPANNWTPNNFSVTGVVDQTPAGLSYRDSSTASRNWDQSSASSSTSNAISPDRIYWVDLGSNKSFNRITFSVVASGQSADTGTNFITYFSTSSSSTGSTICGGGCTVTSASRPSSTTPGTITVTFAGFASQTGRYIGITNGSAAQGGTYTYSNFKVYDDQGKDNDSLVDVPTNGAQTDTGVGGEVRGNYATFNPLVVVGADTYGGTNGNLDSSGGSRFSSSTIAVSSGKYYFETTVGNSDVTVGIWQPPFVASSAPSAQTNYRYYGVDGKIYTQAGATATTYNTYTSGDVIGIALDLDNGKVFFSKNGTWQGSSVPASGTNPAASSLTGLWVFGVNHSTNATHSANFGQRPFAYTAPSGFKALCTANLTTPLVVKPNTVMDVKLYTGTGSSQTVSGLGFGPDLVWIKARNTVSTVNRPHQLFDTVREAPKALSSNRTDAEDASGGYDNDGALTAFTSDGFTVESGPAVGNSGSPYVAWAWDAGSSTVTNTQGSITSTVRANATAGFSVVTFTSNSSGNATVGHGLGVAPSLVILKNRTGGAGNWLVFHKAVCTKDNFLYLNSTNALGTYTDVQGAAIPSSTVFGINAGIGIAGSADCVAYCFAPVVGYSSFGSYTGNGSTDGPFVYTGFRPAFVMMKMSSSTSHWWMNDNKRTGAYNVADGLLFPNLSSAESTFATMDFLSNGFKLRAASSDINTSSATYIYAAFAESPFNYSRAR